MKQRILQKKKEKKLTAGASRFGVCSSVTVAMKHLEREIEWLSTKICA